MRTVTVSHNWYSFPLCLGIAVPTVFSVPSDVSCWDQGRVCQVWSGLVGMEAELGHSLTETHQMHIQSSLHNLEKIPMVTSEKLAEPLSYEEIQMVLLQSPNHKSPGLNGIPTELYKKLNNR